MQPIAKYSLLWSPRDLFQRLCSWGSTHNIIYKPILPITWYYILFIYMNEIQRKNDMFIKMRTKFTGNYFICLKNETAKIIETLISLRRLIS